MAKARSLSEFQKEFPDETSCVAFLFKQRWPDGFVCPVCDKRRMAALKGRRRLYECLDGGPANLDHGGHSDASFEALPLRHGSGAAHRSADPTFQRHVGAAT